jgi:hypothetical protein
MKYLSKKFYPGYFLLLIMALTGLPVLSFGQSGFYMSWNAGVNVSYNRLEADKPLPPDPVALHRAGTCLDFGMHYRFQPRFSFDVHTKGASIKRGLIGKDGKVTDRDPPTEGNNSGVVFLKSWPLHLMAGVSIFPVVSRKVDWKIGTGFGPVFFKYTYDDFLFLEMDFEDQYFEAILEDQRPRHNGWLFNLNTSLAYNVSERAHPGGFEEVFDYRSIRYYYRDKSSRATDRYNVRILNDGTYSSCTVGYSYKLFSSVKNPGSNLTTPRYSL